MYRGIAIGVGQVLDSMIPKRVVFAFTQLVE